jgi:hypothetical protein
VADNTTIDPGTGGDTLRDKDRAGIKTPIVARVGSAERPEPVRPRFSARATRRTAWTWT